MPTRCLCYPNGVTPDDHGAEASLFIGRLGSGAPGAQMSFVCTKGALSTSLDRHITSHATSNMFLNMQANQPAQRVVRASGTRRVSRRSVVVRAAVNLDQLRGARAAVAELISKTSSNPILVRLGWHDAGTYDQVSKNRQCVLLSAR